MSRKRVNFVGATLCGAAAMGALLLSTAAVWATDNGSGANKDDIQKACDATHEACLVTCNAIHPKDLGALNSCTRARDYNALQCTKSTSAVSKQPGKQPDANRRRPHG